MTLSNAGPAAVDLAIGQTWRIRVVGGATAPSLAVILPDDTMLGTPVIFEADGRNDASEQYWLATFPPQEPGRYVGAVTDGEGGSVLVVAHVSNVSLNATYPGAGSLDDWLGVGEHSWSEPELAEAMLVALSAQRRVCRVGAVLHPDLREAAHRRGARYLFQRKQLTAQPRDDGDFDSGPTLPPGRDFEVRALEAPFRRTPKG